MSCLYRLEYVENHFTCFHEIYPVFLPSENLRTFQSRADVDEKDIDALTQLLSSWHFTREQSSILQMRLNYINGRYRIAIGDYPCGIACIKHGLHLAEQVEDKSYQHRLGLQMIFYGMNTIWISLITAPRAPKAGSFRAGRFALR